MNLVLRNVRIGLFEDRSDVLISGGKIERIQSRLNLRLPSINFFGGRLLPGLVDHHVHLSAWSRAERSTLWTTSCESTAFLDHLAKSSRKPSGWAVFFGYDHNSSPGALYALDKLSFPVLVVHRTGHAAFLNRVARDVTGREALVYTGIGTQWSEALGTEPPNEEWARFRTLRRLLLSRGVVAVQDATPYPKGAESRIGLLSEWLSPIEVRVMGTPDNPVSGALFAKVLEPTLRWSESRIPIAVHAVEPREIAVAASLVSRRDRIEHCAICPPPLVEAVAHSGATVCVNPGFLVSRVEALAALQVTGEADYYMPIRELAHAGVPILIGSDAPVSQMDPWEGVLGATRRGQPGVSFGSPVSMGEALGMVALFPEVLSLETSAWEGKPASLTVIDSLPCDSGSSRPKSLATMIDGVVVHRAL